MFLQRGAEEEVAGKGAKGTVQFALVIHNPLTPLTISTTSSTHHECNPSPPPSQNPTGQLESLKAVARGENTFLPPLAVYVGE